MLVAAQHGHCEVARLLVDAKACLGPTCAGMHGDNRATPVFTAADSGCHADALHVLLQAKADANDAEKAEVVRRLSPQLSVGTPNRGQGRPCRRAVGAARYQGRSTPTFLAATQGHTDALRVLVQAKVDVSKAETA